MRGEKLNHRRSGKEIEFLPKKIYIGLETCISLSKEEHSTSPVNNTSLLFNDFL